jgi:hypothetical protein
MSEQTREHSYGPAIDVLTRVIEILDEPGAALGYLYGLHQGDWGHLKVARARDELRQVRDAMEGHERIIGS